MHRYPSGGGTACPLLICSAVLHIWSKGKALRLISTDFDSRLLPVVLTVEVQMCWWRPRVGLTTSPVSVDCDCGLRVFSHSLNRCAFRWYPAGCNSQSCSGHDCVLSGKQANQHCEACILAIWHYHALSTCRVLAFRATVSLSIDNLAYFRMLLLKHLLNIDFAYFCRKCGPATQLIWKHLFTTPAHRRLDSLGVLFCHMWNWADDTQPSAQKKENTVCSLHLHCFSVSPHSF